MATIGNGWGGMAMGVRADPAPRAHRNPASEGWKGAEFLDNRARAQVGSRAGGRWGGPAGGAGAARWRHPQAIKETAVPGFARRLRLAAFASALALPLVAVAPGAAHATTATIKRSLQNLLLFPVDFALSPYVATRTVYNQWRASDDTDAVKIVYPLPGVAWAVSAGALELLPGLVLIPFDTDLDPLYDLSENNNALYDSGEEGPARVRVGVDYIAPSEF
jgi:hypothetical protein